MNDQVSQPRLEWKDLCLTHRKSNREILKHCSGFVYNGDSMAIMGPSGAGKSSLLSLLTARIDFSNSQYILTGERLLDGKPYSLKQFASLSAYVQQEDLLFGTLTVRETFLFHARLRLWAVSPQLQLKKCEDILTKLNLRQCADTLIGNSQFKKSISGGQKKRVAIGVQLISNPQILVLDEPTSGLDSHNALVIMKLLRALSEQGRVVIATIHQPSTRIFQNMQLLYLLNKGEVVYDGQASAIVDYMERIGIKINYNMNPADFFMLEISAMKELQGHTTLLNVDSWKQNRTEKNILQERKEIVLHNDQLEVDFGDAPILTQIAVLIYRSWRQFYRSPSNLAGKLVTIFLIPFIMSSLYFDIADRAPASIIDEPKQLREFLQDFTSFIFMSTYFVFAMAVYDSVLIFPSEKGLVLRETSANLYSLVTYYFSRLFTEILGIVIPTILNAITIYFFAGLDFGASYFLVFIAMFVLQSFIGYTFGIFFGALCRDAASATALIPLALIPMLVFAGLAVNIETMPQYIRWMQYISPIRHGYFAIILNQFESETLHHYADIPGFLKTLGIVSNMAECFYCSCILMVCFSIGSLLMLYLAKKKQ